MRFLEYGVYGGGCVTIAVVWAGGGAADSIADAVIFPSSLSSLPLPSSLEESNQSKSCNSNAIDGTI